MKYLNFSKKFIAMAMAILVLNACDKIEAPQPMGDAGQTIVKFTDTYRLINVDFVSTPQELTILDLRRDIPNSTELGREMTVIVKDDPGAVTAYDPALVAPPAGLLVFDPSVTKIGSNYTFKFKASEFAKVFTAKLLNATNLSLTNRYAIGFSIVSADADGKILGSQKTIIVEIGAKNAYDGIFKLHGYVIRQADPLLTGLFGPVEVSLTTVGAKSVTMNYHPWATGSGSQFAPTVVPSYTVDATTNLVTCYSPGGAYPGGITNFSDLVPGSYVSRYDPSAKTFYVKYTWGGGPGVRECTDTLEYLRPR
jgi:hypothetical protein